MALARGKVGWMLVAVAPVAFSGCAGVRSPAANVHQGTVDGSSGLAQSDWLVTNPKWERVLAFRDARATSPEGYVKVQITIENLSKREVDYETMFEWLDQAGMKIRDYTERWAPGQVAARATKEVQGVAPTPDAVRYRFHIRPPSPLVEAERK